MNYVRSISGSLSSTWNSINPATLSGAIDVIVVEHEDGQLRSDLVPGFNADETALPGSLSCSPFHVRFGKLSLLRPYEKKVEFRVNNVRQDYAMKLGEGGEAFFVFETTSHVPENLQTSPLVSPASSPQTRPTSSSSDTIISEPEPLDISSQPDKTSAISRPRPIAAPVLSPEMRSQSDYGGVLLSKSLPDEHSALEQSPTSRPAFTGKILTSEDIPTRSSTLRRAESDSSKDTSGVRSSSPPSLPKHKALARAMTLSRKLSSSNIPSKVNDEGHLMLDMTGYKSSDEELMRGEVIARQILSEEIEGHYDIGSLIGADEHGNLWIYSSEKAKETASRKMLYPGMTTQGMESNDAVSDPGYHSDDSHSQKDVLLNKDRHHRGSDSAVGLNSPPESPSSSSAALTQQESNTSYAKTLRLTSDQLRALKLRPGSNSMSFTVNRATIHAHMHLWRHDVPIVVSDVDGTITRSDIKGHAFYMIGRDWTHLGVAKLYSDISANGYNILYLTSRSVGQADSTRNYITGIYQDGYKMPKGAVIMSPDRTMAALRREVYLRKPEIFKMACLRDIMQLFQMRNTPFYAGFGNRFTDALSYRSVNIPSTRIFTINSNAEVQLDMLSLNKYKTGYTLMRETVDHFFPPVSMLVQEGGEEFTDFNYWRETTLPMDQFSLSDSSEDGNDRGTNSKATARRVRSDERSASESDVGSDAEDHDDDEEGYDEEDEEVFSDDNLMESSYLSRSGDSIDNSDLRASLDSLDRQSTRTSSRRASRDIHANGNATSERHYRSSRSASKLMSSLSLDEIANQGAGVAQEADTPMEHGYEEEDEDDEGEDDAHEMDLIAAAAGEGNSNRRHRQSSSGSRGGLRKSSSAR
ncbi:MAG: hypothetical protein M1831_001774 [Alyxoria varia]|nr:MAG: hypothetical protein M1831_001774 [Alyxoria varia]